jgi:8-oxo-dGTP pyrophosphatase MutT (NUDIX family)
MSTRKKIYRAGVIPYHFLEDQLQMMFMTPNDSKGKFGGELPQIAKGKREEGESDKQTALREAKEELGLFNGNIIKLTKLGNFLGRTIVYIAEIKDPKLFGDPHFETKEINWLTPEEFQKKGRGLHKPVIKAAVRKMEELHKT